MKEKLLIRSTLITLTLLSMVLLSCDSSSDEDSYSQDTVYATTPDQECLYSGLCTYPNPLPTGWAAYPQTVNGYYNGYNVRYQNGFCGCPRGTQPVYNDSFGLACVNHNYLYPETYAYNYWQWGHRGFYNFSTYSGVGYNVYRRNNCWKGALSACVVGRGCASGRCVLVPGTQYGLCSQ